MAAWQGDYRREGRGVNRVVGALTLSRDELLDGKGRIVLDQNDGTLGWDRITPTA